MWRRSSVRVQLRMRPLLLVAVLALVMTASSWSPPGAAPPVEPVAVAPDAGSALLAARLQGSRVEVADLRTSTRAVFADPDGTLTAELSVVPTRVQRGGSWVPVQTTIASHGDGTVGPKAAVGDLSLSGGGSTAPLARLVKDGRSFALYWPGELPTPRLAGNVATYPDVLPGVDLTMHAETNGYRQQLVIKTPDAARNPALAQIGFRIETAGLRLEVGDSGVLRAVDDAGEPVFVAPPSLMWDSSGDAGTARTAPVGVEVRDGWLILRPDPEFLADPAMVFPVVVDPDLRTWDKSNWATTLSGKATTSYWWSSGDPNGWAQVGNCYTAGGECNSIGVARAYFQYDTSFLNGRRILGSVLNSVVVHSPNCSDQPHQAWLADRHIDPETNWNNQPQGVSATNYLAPPVYPNGNCGGHKPIGAGVVNTGGVTTYILTAADEVNQLAWRKLDPGQTRLSVTYNTGPHQPTELSTDPPLPAPCRWCDGTPYLGDEFIRFQARLSDPDGDVVKPKWITNDNGTEFVDWGVLQNSGATHDINIDLRNRHNRRIRWQVQTWDTFNGNILDASDWAFGPSPFVVDRVAPGVAPTVSGVLYREDNRWHGGAGVPDTFTFGANGVGDIDHYRWGWSDPPTNKVDAATRLGDNATVQLTPPGDGPRDLFVQSVDRAGHRSSTRVYRFFVRAGSGPLAHWPLDGNVTDTAHLGDRHGNLTGPASYAPGAISSAAQLSDGAYVTAPNAVRTDASFSAAAWVRLDEAGGTRTAVVQAGGVASGFGFGYRTDNGGRWAFATAHTDSASPATDLVLSAQPAQLRTWTHLAVVQDAPRNELRLFVNGILSGTVAHSSRWNTPGPVQIGAGYWNGQRTNYWRGAIDEVQIYDRVISEPEVRAMVSRDDVTAGHWRFDDERVVGGQPNTLARNTVEGGDVGTLSNGAAFTEQGARKGAVQFDGIDDQVVMSRPAMRTDQSFSVAAWVNADRLVTGTHMTAVAQLGVVNSGFVLQYNSGHRKWVFMMPSTDTEDGQWIPAVASQQPIAGQWTHLAGVYDAAAQQLRIYVNGQLGGSRQWSATWNAAGPVVVGRGTSRGNPAEHWPGSIDEVRLYSRALSDADVRAVVSRDNVTAGMWRLDGNANDSSGRGLNGTLHGGPTWTSGQTSMADPSDLAVTLNGSSSHVSAPSAVDPIRSFSVAAWARLDQLRTGAAVVSQDAGRISVFNLHNAWDGRWVFAMRSCDASWNCTETRVVGTAAQAGVWVHLVGTYDAVRGELAIFVNGVLAGTRAYTHTWNYPPGALLIGRATWGNAAPVDFFPGAIDDVTVYSRPLFSDEIRTLAGRDLSLVHHWRLDETSGTAADAIGARGATPAGGATYGPGRVGNSIRLDGTDDVVSTTGVDLRTDQSLAVSAWVYLDRADRTVTAVSLDGPVASKFRLGHVVDDEHPDGAWTFECPESDGTVTEAAVSRLPGEVGTWVHLSGVYDAQTRRIWLYVNGDRIDDGTLNAPWQATGGLQIGRGKANGAAAGFWPGSVDDVRLYADALDRDRVGALYQSYPRG